MIFRVEVAFTTEEVIRLMLKGMEAEGVLEERKLPNSVFSYNLKIPGMDGKLIRQKNEDVSTPVLVLTNVQRRED